MMTAGGRRIGTMRKLFNRQQRERTFGKRALTNVKLDDNLVIVEYVIAYSLIVIVIVIK
jgi:hypothetical protein